MLSHKGRAVEIAKWVRAGLMGFNEAVFRKSVPDWLVPKLSSDHAETGKRLRCGSSTRIALWGREVRPKPGTSYLPSGSIFTSHDRRGEQNSNGTPDDAIMGHVKHLAKRPQISADPEVAS